MRVSYRLGYKVSVIKDIVPRTKKWAWLVKGKYVRMSGKFQAPVLIMMCKLCEIWGSYRGMVLVSLPNM